MSDAYRNGHPAGVDPAWLLPSQNPVIPPDPDMPVPLFRKTGQTRQAVLVRTEGLPPHTDHQTNQKIFDLKFLNSGAQQDAAVFYFAAEDASEYLYRGFATAKLGKSSDTRVQVLSGSKSSNEQSVKSGASTLTISARVTQSPPSDGSTLKIRVSWTPSNTASDRYLVAFPTRVRSKSTWSFSDYVKQGVIVRANTRYSKTLTIPSGNKNTDYAVCVVKSSKNLVVSATTPTYYKLMAPTVISNVVLVDSGS